MYRKYDFEKLQKLLNENQNEEIMVSTFHDSHWTMTILTQEKIDAKEFAGIDGSNWDIPGYWRENSEEFTPCYVEEEDDK